MVFLRCLSPVLSWSYHVASSFFPPHSEQETHLTSESHSQHSSRKSTVYNPHTHIPRHTSVPFWFRKRMNTHRETFLSHDYTEAAGRTREVTSEAPNWNVYYTLIRSHRLHKLSDFLLPTLERISAEWLDEVTTVELKSFIVLIKKDGC